MREIKDLWPEILKKIKSQHMTPTPRYVFVFRNILLWGIFGISVFVGAFSLGSILDYLLLADWETSGRLGLFRVFFIFLPISWLLFMLIFSLISYYNFRHTPKGYKKSMLSILFLNITLSLFGGIFLTFSGVNGYLHQEISRVFPVYRDFFNEDIEQRMIAVWQNEDEGLLLGEILEYSASRILLQDSQKKVWTLRLENAEIKASVHLEIGEKIKIMGEKISENEFLVQEIRHYNGKMQGRGARDGSGRK